MYMVAAEDHDNIENCLVDAKMFVMDNQNQFSIDFCVNMKAYFFHVLAQGHMMTSRKVNYSCAMCCTNFQPQCWIATLTTKLKKALKMWENIETKFGLQKDPEDCVFLHKIKIEINPILIFLKKLGPLCPLNQRVKGRNGESIAAHSHQLEVKCGMLKQPYEYIGDNLAPLKKLYTVNGWSEDLLAGADK